MVVTSIMTTGAEITSKEGAGVAVAVDDTMHDAWVLQAESFVNVFIRINFSDAITTGLNVDVKHIFSDIVSSMVAIHGILYDTTGYDTLQEAEDKVQVLRDGILRNLSILRDKKYTDFINAA